MKLFTLFAAALIGAAAWAQQEDPAADAVRRLGSENYETREKAAADLRKLGAQALPALRQAATGEADPEVRLRARQILDELERGAKPAPAPRPAQRAVRPGTMSVRMVNGDASYTLAPESGDPITLHRRADGSMRLDYPDGSGGTKSAEAASVEKFVSEHAELARKFGITAEGIEYGGLKASFNARGRFPGLPRGLEEPGTEPFSRLQEELRRMLEEMRREAPGFPPDWEPKGFFSTPVIKGARVGEVPDLLRAHLAIPEGRGVVIESVREGSTAESLGLKRHDILLEIDGRKVGSVRDLAEGLSRSSTLKVLRGGKEQALTPPPKEY